MVCLPRLLTLVRWHFGHRSVCSDRVGARTRPSLRHFLPLMPSCRDSRVIRAFGQLPRAQLAAIQSDPTLLHKPTALLGQLTQADIQRLILAYQQGYRLLWQICAGLLGAATIGTMLLRPVSAIEDDVDEQREKSKAWLEGRKALKQSKRKP